MTAQSPFHQCHRHSLAAGLHPSFLLPSGPAPQPGLGHHAGLRGLPDLKIPQLRPEDLFPPAYKLLLLSHIT